MMILAGLLLVPTKYERAADRVVFPSAREMSRWANKSAGHKRVIAMIEDRAIWAKAFQRIERKLGLFNPEGRVQVYIEASSDPRPALGGGHQGTGHIRFNIPRLVRYLEELDAFNRLKAAGRIDRVIVPPMNFYKLICH